MSTAVVQKKRGRPITVKGPVTAIRLTPELTVAIDEWRRQQQDLPGRSAAIRRLVEKALKRK